jgi:tetratricopeptide (TPR) repeat protein
MNLGSRLGQAVLLFLIGAVGDFALTAAATGQGEPSQPSPTPPWKRPLSGAAAVQVAKLEQQIAQLGRAGRFAEAIKPAGEAAEIRTRLQGGDHWQAADAHRAVVDLRKIAALPEEGRKALASVGDLGQKADAERQRGHFSESERINRVLLETYRRWLGEDHPLIAGSYNNIAYLLDAQGKYAEAEPLCRKALAIRLKSVGGATPILPSATTTSP